MKKTSRSIPAVTPEKGFYYHYKHKDTDEVNFQAYEVVGTGVNTEEEDCRLEDANMVVYRPLYNVDIYEAGKLFNLRPLGMFMENLTKDGKNFPRFKKITDTKVLAVLEAIKMEMYGNSN